MHFATNLKQNKKPAHRFDVTDMVTFVTVAPEFIDDPRIKSHFQSMANQDKRSYILSNGTTINPKGLSNNRRNAIKKRSLKRRMDARTRVQIFEIKKVYVASTVFGLATITLAVGLVTNLRQDLAVLPV